MRPTEPRRERGRRRWAALGTAGSTGALMVTIAMNSASLAAPADSDWNARREAMVRTQIEGRGVANARVLDALRFVERHRFVPEYARDHAYEDRPLPIGEGQTISQPYIVAAMTEFLDPQPDDTVLEVGTGSGYQAAVLARLVKRVYSIEIVPELADRARVALAENGFENVIVVTGDGYRGLPDRAPFDGIIVTAAPPVVPQPLLDQLAVGARLVIPVGRFSQELRVFERTADGVRARTAFGVRFVPMTGEAQAPAGEAQAPAGEAQGAPAGDRR